VRRYADAGVAVGADFAVIVAVVRFGAFGAEAALF
jgi:hypothetical protein